MDPSTSPQLLALLERVMALLVRLLGGRIELAAAQLSERALFIARQLSKILLGALALTLGFAFVAAAAIAALQPVVPSLPARLLLVGAPFLLGGALATARGAVLLGRLAPAADQGDRQHHDRQDQEDMNPDIGRISTDDPE